MSEDFEKLVKEALGSSQRSPTAKAIILMSIKQDERFEEILSEIRSNKADTDKKFDKLKVPLFFADNPKLMWFFVVSILAVFGVNSEVINYFKNMFVK